MGESFDVALAEIKKLGFTSETIQLSETIIQNMLHNFEKVRKCLDYFTKLSTLKLDFSFNGPTCLQL